jgi:hypothetical protein
MGCAIPPGALETIPQAIIGKTFNPLQDSLRALIPLDAYCLPQ